MKGEIVLNDYREVLDQYLTNLDNMAAFSIERNDATSKFIVEGGLKDCKNERERDALLWVTFPEIHQKLEALKFELAANKAQIAMFEAELKYYTQNESTSVVIE